MNKRLILIGMLFLSACGRGECNGLGQKGVCIRIVNKSGQSAVKIILRKKPNKYQITNRIIENNHETYISYYSGGESSYQLFVVLKNGDTVKSVDVYAEGGYRLKETIGRKKIETTYNSY